jgi:hypothetical protein
MAAKAIVYNSVMINGIGRPAYCAMAVVTLTGCCDVIGGFSIRKYTIVTTRAITDNWNMINSINRRKTDRAVAVLTAVSAKDVVGILAGRYGAIVAKLAISGNPIVVKYCT